jgi:hypothetical protein
MDSRLDENATKRREMRKGTHSCTECRRRKVKCVFSTPDSDTCTVCLRRGSRCFSQADSPVPVKNIDMGAETETAAGFPLNPHVLPTATPSFVVSFAHPHSNAYVSSAFISPGIAAPTALQYGLLAYQPSSAKSQHHLRVSHEGVSAVSSTSAGESQHMVTGETTGGIPSMMMPCCYVSAQTAGVEPESRPREAVTTPAEHISEGYATERMEGGNAQDASPQAAALSNPPMMPNDVAPPFPAACFDDTVMDTLLY